MSASLDPRPQPARESDSERQPAPLQGEYRLAALGQQLCGVLERIEVLKKPIRR